MPYFEIKVKRNDTAYKTISKNKESQFFLLEWKQSKVNWSSKGLFIDQMFLFFPLEDKIFQLVLLLSWILSHWLPSQTFLFLFLSFNLYYEKIDFLPAGCHMLSQQPGQLRSPPVITHTAATPQGSPNISSSRLGRPPYKDANIYLDSDSHSVVRRE